MPTALSLIVWVMMTGPLMAYAADQLKARFTVHELWKAEDKAAFLREISGRVRGIAGRPHFARGPF